MDKALPAILSWTYPNDSDESIPPPLPQPMQPSSEHPKFDYDKLIPEIDLSLLASCIHR